ncbi:hypothetical protein [Alteribacter aurantiacus]|uniref:hypothetical protein n=1 Tax=Alteribacter aurantiacus TaxID=254410 RepID=UPI0003F9F1A8|nr:hypothetical protein [Alteribacter aurantiacus]
MKESRKRMIPLGLIGIIVLGGVFLLQDHETNSKSKEERKERFLSDFSADLEEAVTHLNRITNSDYEDLESELHELNTIFVRMDERLYEESEQTNEVEYSKLFDEFTFLTTGRYEKDGVIVYEGAPFYENGKLSGGERALIHIIATDLHDASHFFIQDEIDTYEAFHDQINRVAEQDHLAFYERVLERYSDTTLYDSFHGMMNVQVDRNEQPYSVIKMEEGVLSEDDGIVVFTEENSQGEQIFLAYFEKVDDQWYWQQSLGANVKEGQVNWTASQRFPHFYVGIIHDEKVDRVEVGGQEADIIPVKDGARFWYVHASDGDVVYVKIDGTNRIVERLNY